MSKSILCAGALRDELNQAVIRLSFDGESRRIDFMLPTLADPDDGPSDHNWDVQADCPEGFDELARRAVEQVAAIWDLQAD